ncbi:carboxylesterase/lipase family protein [Flavobacterium sp. WC2429]|uniref:Carboxylic ester hydrolase n=2 Tax=unclassified Flavobacterium TaxID=196869 RepID=A0AB39W6X2_9FLAO
MKKIIGLAIFISCSLYSQLKVNNATPEASPIVKTASGSLRGITEGDVSVFKGIPYATAPVGEYRWRPPQPIKAWVGVRDASKFESNFAQAGWGAAPGSLSEGSSEDGLYLNLWLPAGTKPGAKLPVMVWIHGGAFVFGSGSQPDFSGVQFAKQGVILITFNYRLGRLGFFAFPALSNEHPEEPKGNYAYMDQIAALKWVKENIAAFGGNPKNVTIFGESAGGVSVHSLLTIPVAKGLFQKAIIESGGGRDGVLTGRPIHEENADRHYPVSAETIGKNFAHKHGIEGIDATALAKLRSLSVADIVDGGQETDGPGGLPIYSGPILDGKLVVETAESAYKSGRQARVPLLIGSNSAEVPVGFVNAKSKEELLTLFGNFNEEAIAAYDANGTADFAKMLTLVNTDKVWAEPARFTARAFVSKSIPVYTYLFSYVPIAMKDRMKYGASHASEIPFVFDNLIERNGFKFDAKDKEVSKMMNSYWVNFAKTGNPNRKGLPIWSLYDTTKNNIFEFKEDGSAGNFLDYRKARLDVIEKAFEDNK